MKSDLLITTNPIEQAKLASSAPLLPSMGAVIHFQGVVRNAEANGAILGLEYEAFAKMAQHQFELIFHELEERWPIHSVRLVHRIGFVAAGEASLWIEIVAPHRGEGFAACQHLIDEMKRRVPIWKKPIPVSSP